MKAIILARVSTDDQMQEGFSIPAQLQRAQDYCHRKGLEIQSEYQFDESSTSDQRVKFELVIEEVRKASEVIALVVETVDRLQRSFKESVMLDELRKAGKIELHFIRENLVIHRNSNSSEIQRWDLAVFVAKSYVLQLSDNVKRSFDLKRKRGEWTGKPPIGYTGLFNSEGRRTDIVFDTKNSHLIKKIFELYATGRFSTLTLRKEIAKEGLLSSKGKPLAPSMIDHILNNTFYYGVAYSRTKDEYWNHCYQPLIDKYLFDKCQEVRKNWNKQPFKYASKPYIFRGLLRCAKCGCSMSPETAKGKYIFYSCTNAKKGICDKKIYIPERDILKPLYEVLGAFNAIPQVKIDEIVEGLKQTNQLKNIYHKNKIEALQIEYNEIDEKLKRLMDLLIDMSITQQDYDKKVREFKDRQYILNIELDEHTKADESYYLTASTVLNLAKGAKELFESSDVPRKNTILKCLLQNSTIDEKTVNLQLKSPFCYILDLKINSKLPG